MEEAFPASKWATDMPGGVVIATQAIIKLKESHVFPNTPLTTHIFLIILLLSPLVHEV